MHSKVLNFAKRKRGGDLVGGGDGSHVASTGISGLDTSSKAKRLKPGVRNGGDE